MKSLGFIESLFVGMLALIAMFLISINLHAARTEVYLQNAVRQAVFQPVIYTPSVIEPDEFDCLSKTIYFEARGEPIEGQFAVAEVVLERVNNADYPDTVCEVVKEARKPGLLKCQFSWWCDGKSDSPTDMKAYAQSQIVSALAISGVTSLFLSDSTHYHADYVSPDWSEEFQLISKIGKHYFYQ